MNNDTSKVKYTQRLTVLEGIDPVRSGPEYIGGFAPAGRQHLVWEFSTTLSMSDERYAANIWVTLPRMAARNVEADGGASGDSPATKKSALEVSFTCCMPGKFEQGNYKPPAASTASAPA